MDLNTITQFITSIGFPIACCLACFWYINKSDEQHKEELAKLSDALNNNTLVIQKLLDKMEAE